MNTVIMDAITKSIIEDRAIENISEAGIRKTDELNGLECFCFSSDSEPEDEIERSVRGDIFYNDTLVLKSIPYGKKFVITDGDCEFAHELDFKNMKFHAMQEGSEVRVFKFNNIWYTTTHRKLDAFKSTWGASESFGKMFENLVLLKFNMSLNEFYDTYLDEKFYYCFFIGTNSITRIVAPPHNDLYLTACVDIKTKKCVDYPKLKCIFQKSLRFQNFQEMCDYVRNLNKPFMSSGIFILDSKTLKNYRIINKEYDDLSKLRNNNASLKFAYINLMFDEEKNKKFRELYSDQINVFDECNKELLEICKQIHSLYIKRHVEKQWFEVSKHEHRVLCEIHKYYMDSKLATTVKTVEEVLKKTNPTNINRIINDRRKLLKQQQTSIKV